MKKFLMLAAMAALGAATSAYAQSYTETGDAGNMPNTAQTAAGSGALTDLFGGLSGVQDADMYLIDIKDWSTFSATTNVAPGTMTDTTLYIFRLDGTGVAKNDDIS